MLQKAPSIYGILLNFFIPRRRKIVQETLLKFHQSWDVWTSWRLFNIILIKFVTFKKKIFFSLKKIILLCLVFFFLIKKVFSSQYNLLVNQNKTIF